MNLPMTIIKLLHLTIISFCICLEVYANKSYLIDGDLSKTILTIRHLPIKNPGKNTVMNAVSHRQNASYTMNGVIALLLESSKFDPSPNPNPLTDCDKTVHS